MSWLNDLYCTYESCKGEVGVVRDNQPVLLPIAHSTQNAQLEVVLDAEGNFSRAFRVEKEDAVTVIPVSEDSGSRSGSAVFPHPLADKLEYVAGDYTDFVSKGKAEKNVKYKEQLYEWVTSPYSLPQIKSVYLYLNKDCLMHDLEREGLFFFENGQLLTEKQQGIAAEDWFVRFSVEIPQKEECRLYCDSEIFDSYIAYYLSKQELRDLCYVSGEMVPCSEKHPAKIRNTGDKAKLISTNDASGIFTYKGRFKKSSQVAMVSYEISQKAHNALRWLIAKQACLRVEEQVFLVWSIENPELTDPFDEFFMDEEDNAYTDEAYANCVKRAIWGSSEIPPENANVMIIGVEAATTGRLSIPFYQKYEAKQFLENIVKWKSEVCWVRKCTKEDKVSAWSPSLVEIVKLVAGEKNDKLNKSIRERLIPCIVERRRLPYDIVLCAAQKAMNRMRYGQDYIAWNRAIGIACALIRKYRLEKGEKKEEETMGLNEESQDRSYIFGRLIATAEMLERSALLTNNGKEGLRNTTAEKYFVRMQRYPVETYNTIYKQLNPYIRKLKSAGKTFYVNRLDELVDKLDFTQKGKLEPIFLQGYSSQMVNYRNHFKQNEGENKEEEV